MPTIYDVARKAGVSKTTVSRVLNRPDLVNSETKKRVLRVIKELSYSPSILAQGMRGQKTRSIGVVIPDFTNLYYSEFLKYVELAARSEGYISVVCSTEIDPAREKEYIIQLLRRQIDGLILCWYKGVAEYRSYLIKLAKRIPVVIMDQPSEGLPISSVYSDGHKGIKDLTSYLIKKGYKEIAVIRGLKKYGVVESRFKGYIDALKENDIEIDSKLIEESEFTAAGGYRAAGRLFERSRPRAMVGITDLIAIGALKYILESGFSVPHEIAVGGFDNIPLSSLVSPQLTTVAQPIEKMAIEATKQLIKKINNRHVRNRDIVFNNRLIIRESTDIKKKDDILM